MNFKNIDQKMHIHLYVCVVYTTFMGGIKYLRNQVRVLRHQILLFCWYVKLDIDLTNS